MASALQIVQSESNDQIRLNNNAPCELREISTILICYYLFPSTLVSRYFDLVGFHFFFSFFLLQYLLVHFKSAAGGDGEIRRGLYVIFLLI